MSSQSQTMHRVQTPGKMHAAASECGVPSALCFIYIYMYACSFELGHSWCNVFRSTVALAGHLWRNSPEVVGYFVLLPVHRVPCGQRPPPPNVCCQCFFLFFFTLRGFWGQGSRPTTHVALTLGCSMCERCASRAFPALLTQFPRGRGILRAPFRSIESHAGKGPQRSLSMFHVFFSLGGFRGLRDPAQPYMWP